MLGPLIAAAMISGACADIVFDAGSNYAVTTNEDHTNGTLYSVVKLKVRVINGETLPEGMYYGDLTGPKGESASIDTTQPKWKENLTFTALTHLLIFSVFGDLSSRVSILGYILQWERANSSSLMVDTSILLYWMMKVTNQSKVLTVPFFWMPILVVIVAQAIHVRKTNKR